MNLRSVAIKGNIRQATQAVKLLYDCLERHAYTVEDFDTRVAVSLSLFHFHSLFSNICYLLVEAYVQRSD